MNPRIYYQYFLDRVIEENEAKTPTIQILYFSFYTSFSTLLIKCRAANAFQYF